MEQTSRKKIKVTEEALYYEEEVPGTNIYHKILTMLQEYPIPEITRGLFDHIPYVR